MHIKINSTYIPLSLATMYDDGPAGMRVRGPDGLIYRVVGESEMALRGLLEILEGCGKVIDLAQAFEPAEVKKPALEPIPKLDLPKISLKPAKKTLS